MGGLVQAMEADHIQTTLVVEFGRVGEDACEQVVDLVGLIVFFFFGVVKTSGIKGMGWCLVSHA